MATAYLVSTALMAVLAVAVVAWLMNGRQWYQYAPPARDAAGLPEPADAADGGPIGRLASQPAVQLAAFALLVVAVLVLPVVYISAPGGSQPMVGMAIAVGGGALVVGYLLYGVYAAASGRGHPRSLAVAESATVGGALFLVAIVVRLVM
ncbi:hypothetical protein ACFQL1_11585 [Halomicroarcula sp. GCM10025709]|uniref:hypothetical protein n=1 Tax=Haloarcula TaxID=2237 RepID=UPI0024C34A74|nr:hypothetical protein [Halomicroarcula sp. YJ-61-S]